MTEIPLDVVSRRIRGLLAKTVENGCTEQEAIAAAELARKLMDTYRLSQSDVEIQAEPMEDVTLERHVKAAVAAVDTCMGGIQRYCGVKMWFHATREGRNKITRRVRMIGLKADVEMATWLYRMIGAAIKAETKAFRPEPGLSRAATQQANTSFRLGMAGRVNARLIEMAIALEPVAKTASGTALVVVKGALVADAFAKLGLRFNHTSKAKQVRDFEAWLAGGEAGDRVNLNRPVGAAAPARRLH
jgi:hypothetical protein